MERIGKTGMWVWLLLLAVSCTRTEVEEKDLPPHPAKEVEAVFNLNVLANRPLQTRSITFTPEGTFEIDSIAPGITDSVATRSAVALTEGDESLISQLWVGQYDASGNRVFSQYISPVTGTTVNLRLKESGEATHHVWFVANCDDLGEIATETVLKEHIFTYTSTAEGLPENRLCGMTGMWSGVIRDNGVESIGVDMTRTVAKISFSYLIGGDGFSFKPSSVKLKSVPDKIRMEETTTQLTDVTYGEYTGESSADGATMHWYLPENRAGVVTGENAATSEKEKTGRGVSNATCIELTGTAVQGGVTYENVTFRFFPGSTDMNDYNIKRNHYYTMSVTLKGIDVTDQRITVGTIPPIDLDGLQPMPAGKGGTTGLQVTARPGDEWTIKLPNWLSALLNDNIPVGYGANIIHQGPAKIVFKAETANPTAQQRSFSFQMNVTGEEQNIEIVQNGSTMNVGSAISLEAASGSEGQSTFTLTKGLNWRALLSDGWLSWASGDPANSGDEATGGEQILKVKAASSNPYASARTGSITVEGGGSVGSSTYNDLKKEISVEQTGSTVTCPTQPVEVSAEGAIDASSLFTATPYLSWKITVSEADNWIGLTGQTTGQTTTNPQNVVFNVPVNPNSEERTGTITVRVGDESKGPTGNIAVQQAASSLTVDEVPTSLAPTAEASGSVAFTATKGLSYTITHPDWLTFTGETTGTTSGDKQTFNYKANSINKNKEARNGNISVAAGNMAKETAISQEASVFKVEPRTIELPNTASSAEATITGTSGLSWELTRAKTGDEAITTVVTSGELTSTSHTVTFSAQANEGGERSADFILAVTGGNHSDTVTVKQASGLNTITINQAVADSYKKYYEDYNSSATALPFYYDGGNYGLSGPYGGDYKGNSDTYLVDAPYTIEVEATQSKSLNMYTAAAIKVCTDKGKGWRIPTMIELYAIWDICRGSNFDATDDEAATYTFGDGMGVRNAQNVVVPYWSSSVGKPYFSVRSVIYFQTGKFNTSGTTGEKNLYPVRCVREK
ncbi:BACON domain-containing protein [Parabacteroides goldsteinii]|uniref:BACON domain-containing protein n=1 Tax=Parabacteroides goldsteinii TaxID=328812 RepID=UPI00242C60C5|nr:BACON domain-containing carbohydrate-binding protein [Parabacteroides goldsteinii]